MDNSDWDNIKPFLKEMFNFDDDILWTVYFNTQMNLQKTIDILVEISDEQKHIMGPSRGVFMTPRLFPCETEMGGQKK